MTRRKRYERARIPLLRNPVVMRRRIHKASRLNRQLFWNNAERVPSTKYTLRNPFWIPWKTDGKTSISQIKNPHHAKNPSGTIWIRQHYSTTIKLSNVLDNITNNLNRQHKTATCLLDLDKAFDDVWHDGLLFKLLASYLRKQLINSIRSILINRTHPVKIDDSASSSRPIKSEIPLGFGLSLHLFSVFINDMVVSQKAKIMIFTAKLYFTLLTKR